MKNKKIIINIAIIAGFMLIASANTFMQQLSNLDEIWIYNFGRCIINGLIPYKDFSIIITPLFAYISAAFLKIFGDEMIVLRFAEILQIALILFMVYKILERLSVNKGVSLLFAMGVYYLYSSVYCFDYNWAVLLLSLIVLYIELKENENSDVNFRKNLILGVLAGTTILLKQTSGIILSIIVIGYKIFEVKNKKDFKNFLSIMLTRSLGVLIPILVFAIYLTINSAWTEFIDYAILGIKTFSNVIPYTRLLQTDYILAFAVPIFLVTIIIISLITLFIKNVRESKWARDLRILMFFDIASAIVIYPIADRMHFAVGTICTLLTVVYLVHVWFVYGLKIKSEKIKYAFDTFFCVIAMLVFVIYSGISLYHTVTYMKSIQDKKFLNHFKYIETTQSLYETINNLDEYIKLKEQEGRDIIILDSIAAPINIPIDKYYKNYDMFNLGNFGAKGEKRHNRRLKIQDKYFDISQKRKI